MRRFLPQTLPVWVLLIVIAGLLVSQVTTLFLVARDQAASSDVVDYYRLNDRAFAVVQLLHSATPEARKSMVSGLSNNGYSLSVSDQPAVVSSIAQNDELAELEDILVARLTRFGVTEARVRRDRTPVAGRAPGSQPDDTDIGDVEKDLLALTAGLAKGHELTASIQFADGQWLNFSEPIIPPGPVLSPESMPLYAIVAALVVAMSVWSIRRLTAPYRVMEGAVKRIGEDLKSEPLNETGSRETRAAARAINTMQGRLRDYVEDREQLAAALAHDLRTPLTRMRLRLELLRASRVRDALAHDLADIEAIASSVVDFATFEITEEKAERLDFLSLVESVADTYAEVTLNEAGMSSRTLVCIARPVALRRCVTNLVQNAVTYGHKAELSLRHDDARMTLVIRDEGPGIPQTKLDAVFHPFVRLEGSRSRETGGLGLGLAIARAIARGAGGDIRLFNRPEGGLETQLNLPLAT